jgi:hypothetical protein
VFVSDASTQVSREVQQLDKQSRHESEGAPGQPEGHAAWTGTMTARLLEYLPLSSHLAAELRTMSVGPSEQAADLDPGNSWASGLLLAAGFAFLWLLVQRVFLLDIDQLGDPSRRDLQHPPGTLKIWVYDHTGEGVEQRVSERVTVDRLDGRRDYTEVDLEEWAREHAAGDGLVEISHLDACLDNTKRTARLLDVVESLAAQRHKALLITSPLDPVEQLAGRLAEEGDQAEQTDPLALLHQRWIDVLGGFSTPSHDIPARENEDGFDRVLEQEYPDIRITSRGESREELETCHRKIWAQCTVPQRLILRQLAEEGFVNPAAAFVVRGLMKRGLIRRDDALKLASPQFREFARHADPEEIVARWEREEGASDWSRLRTPLAATLLIGLGLFLYTQPELSKSALGAATALAAVLPLAMRLFGNAKEEGK